MFIKLNYRPEIDGLRAIAVGAVILYHAQINILGYHYFKGGFIGVDIFFVISGYLITQVILKELLQTGKFSFKYFYQRRIRRILPALLLVMLVSIPFAWLYLLPDNLVDFSKSILSSLIFSSNFYFHYAGQEYGAQESLFLPFLHTWSLSIEEQYYILFPLLLLLTFKYFRKYLIHILIISFVISLGLADYGSRNYASATFYFLHSRMWELLAGAILAYFETTLGSRKKYQILSLISPCVGLFLIGHSIIFFDDKTFHPSFYTLSPIIGVCLIIWFSHKDELITRLLSSKLFVGVGLISYSLYLWHYPVFAFYRFSFASDSLIIKLFLPIGLISVSVLSYFIVEKVCRNKQLQFSTLLKCLLTSVALIFFISLFFIYKKGFPKRAIIDGISIDRELYFSQISNWQKKFEKNTNNNFDNSKNILILGDSHAKNFSMIFQSNKKLFEQYDFYSIENINLLFNYFSNAAMDDNTNLLIKNAHIVIFSYSYISEELKKVEEAIKLIKEKTNKKIILTTNNPMYSLYGSRFTDLDFFLIKNKRKPNSKELIWLEKKYYDFLQGNDSYKYFNNELKKLSEKYNIKLLDKSLYQCSHQNKRCLVLTENNEKINWDSDHHTLAGAKYLGKIIYKSSWFNIN